MSLALAGAQSAYTPRAYTPRGLPFGRSASPAGLESSFARSPRSRSEVSSAPGGARSTLRNVIMVTDFSSDVGRKPFGFSHEELDDSAAYYEGQFKLFQRYGEGVMNNPETGAKYVGQFQRDVYHGEGHNTWPDGSTYSGQWRNGQKHGKGRYASQEGLVYEGQWDGGLRHGRGSQDYANKDKYEGGWWHGLCSGLGTYYYSDGSKFVGAWANGRYDGSGIYIGADGSRERQWYSTGLLTRREVLTRGSSKSQGRRDMIGGKVVFSQTRSDMHRPALLAKQQLSKYLIQRETGGIDLAVQALRDKSAGAMGWQEPGLEDKYASTDASTEPAPLRVLSS